MKPLYEFDEQTREWLISEHLTERRGGEVIARLDGTFGTIYQVRWRNGDLIAAKCPCFKRFGNRQDARQAIENLIHELEKAHSVFMLPWINRFFEVQIINGWPFLLSRFRDGTLEDLISNPIGWSLSDRFCSLIQISRGLRLALDRGISAHQDLKPANILYQDLQRAFRVPRDSLGMHFRMLITDFGLADAFRDFGRNTGSRPYMAPEQFSMEPFDPTVAPAFDVFALGVIAHECFTDGMHPIGTGTSSVWPHRAGIAQKWNRAAIWREWALKPAKQLFLRTEDVGQETHDLLRVALSAEPAKRPSLQEFETVLWSGLKQADPVSHDGLKMQVNDLEASITEDNAWPHMDAELMKLRRFYSEL